MIRQGIFIQTPRGKPKYKQSWGREDLFPCPEAVPVLSWRMDGHKKGQEEEVFSEPEKGTEWAELIM